MPKAPRIEQLETELRLAKERLAKLKRELDEAHELITEMRERLEEVGEYRDTWADAFGFIRTDDGVVVDDEQSIWNQYDGLLADYNKLVRNWNKFAAGTRAPRSRGRPLQASEAHQEEVRKRRKRGESLRGIVAATGLGLGTVRSIIRGKERETRLRKLVFDQHRARSFRARKRVVEIAPKQMTNEAQEVARLIKAAKGLGKS